MNTDWKVVPSGNWSPTATMIQVSLNFSDEEIAMKSREMAEVDRLLARRQEVKGREKGSSTTNLIVYCRHLPRGTRWDCTE